jgi:hypothetical protein
MFEINAAFRLFADAHHEAGVALKAISKVLGSHFVIDEADGKQVVIWRSPLFKAQLMLDTNEDVLEFGFMDKAKTAGFSAEGYNAQTLLKDIRYNVTQFKPTKKVSPEIADLRSKFGAIQ